MRLNVNPNRMELSKLKKRLVTANRGHKLLKDKQDELVRQFILLIRRNDILRKEVEKQLISAYKDFVLVGAISSPDFLEEAVMLPKEKIGVNVETKNIMSVSVPKMDFEKQTIGENLEESDNNIYDTNSNKDVKNIFSYGFSNTSDELDRTLLKIDSILPELLQLGEVEKTCNLLADEIEKTRRRVNALEYMTIPQLQETIKYIKMKLDENERGNITRLMKVKSMMV